jgi:hypothetical protein
VGSALTVGKAHLTVTADSASTAYGTPLPALGATISGFVNRDPASVVTGAASLSTTATGTSGAGVYPVVAGLGTLAAANYDFPNVVAGTLTITRAHLTVTANAATMTYGDPLPTFSAAVSGFVLGDTMSVLSGAPSLNTTATASSGAGVYPIDVGTGTLAAANYDFTNLVSNTLTVGKAHLTVTAGDASITYGAALPFLSATLSGFVTGDTAAVVSGSPALSTTAPAFSPVGTYPISAGVGSLTAANYDFASFVSGTLTIGTAAATLSLGGLVFTYDGSPHPATFSTDPANLTGVAMSYTVNGASVTVPTSAGRYVVVAGLDNPNYTAMAVTATLIINRAPTTLTWSNPADVVSGTALGPAQLDATASVPGAISYSPPAGSVLAGVGPQVLTASFTPSDATDYLPATGQVTLNVDTNVNGPAVVQFSAAEFDVDAAAGMANVVVTRSGSTSTTATVSFATSGGSALAGTDYTPVATTLVFSPGQTSQTIAVPIANNAGSGRDVNVGLILSAPGPATVLGNVLARASLVIRGIDSTPAVTLTSVHVARIRMGKHKTTMVIVVQFSGALAPESADNVANFSLVMTGKQKPPGSRGGRQVALALATYDAAAHSVTLTSRKPLVVNSSLQLSINASGLTDALGRPLIDSNGNPASDFTSIVSKASIRTAATAASGEGAAGPGRGNPASKGWALRQG